MGNFKEKRKYKRVEGIFKVIVDFTPSVPIKFSCHSSDISEGGIRIQSTKNPATGSSVLIMFELPNHTTKKLAMRGVVVWTSEIIQPELKLGRSYLYEAGIKFTDLNEDDREAIRSFVDERSE